MNSRSPVMFTGFAIIVFAISIFIIDEQRRGITDTRLVGVTKHRPQYAVRTKNSALPAMAKQPAESSNPSRANISRIDQVFNLPQVPVAAKPVAAVNLSRPLELPAATPPAKSVALPLPVVSIDFGSQVFLQSIGGGGAFINGRFYSQGDTLDLASMADTNERIRLQKITAAKVILEQQGQLYSIYLDPP